MDTTAQGEFLPQSCKATGQVADHQFSVWQFYTKDATRQDFADHTGGHDGRFGHRERGVRSMRRGPVDCNRFRLPLATGTVRQGWSQIPDGEKDSREREIAPGKDPMPLYFEEREGASGS